MQQEVFMIKITDVKITLKTNQEPLKAFASITFEECFVIHDLRIIKKDERIFVAMPSKKINHSYQNQSYYKDIAHPINKTMREFIENTVLKEYKRIIKDIE